MAPRPERIQLAAERESAEKTAELAKFIERAAAAYRAEGIPVLPDGRINMTAFRDVEPDLQKDEEKVREMKAMFEEQAEAEGLEKSATDGEKLEMLTHAVMHKSLSKKFIVARSSYFDDIYNKTDTILFDRQTGDPICTFDEVGDTKGSLYEKKQAAVRDRNLGKGGITLKYGLKLEDAEGKKKMVPGAVQHIPVFYIALPKDRIEKGVREFEPSAERQSDFEKKLFEYFLQALAFQVQGLEL